MDIGVLSVARVKRRSKRVLYVALLIIGIAVTLITPITNWFFGNPLFKINYVGNIFVFATFVSLFFAVPATIVGISYFFTGRWYIELTTMKGIYRVEIPRGDMQMESLTHQLQREI